MKRNECLDAVVGELRAAGIRDIEYANGGKHLQVRWQVSGRSRRVVTVPVSPSDHRAVANTRADVRRLLRADGMLVIPSPAKETSPPKPDRFTELERRVGALERTLARLVQVMTDGPSVLDEERNENGSTDFLQVRPLTKGV